MSRIYHVHFIPEKLHKINNVFKKHWDNNKVGIEAVFNRVRWCWKTVML